MRSIVTRRGFTLLELMIALLIGTMVLTVGRGLFDAATALTQRLTERFQTSQRIGVARSTLLRTFASARASATSPFIGSGTEVSFESWCPDAFGGFGPCTVRVSARPTLAIEERLLDGSKRTVIGDGTPGRFDYVINATNGGTTVREWNSATMLPIAVRWVALPERPSVEDTLIFAILRSQP